MIALYILSWVIVGLAVHWLAGFDWAYRAEMYGHWQGDFVGVLLWPAVLGLFAMGQLLLWIDQGSISKGWHQ